MATLASLVERVRVEIGDVGQSFVWSEVATGDPRVVMPHAPVDGTSLIVYVDNVDVSTAVEVEEHTGVLVFDNAPQAGDVIQASGIVYRFMTNAEITSFTDAAVQQHLYNQNDAFGRQKTVANLPPIEEYPVTLLASIEVLYALATDSSFDIDIHTPDGVMIPRSERYRQLMDMIAARREQYQMLCQALNIGLHKIEVFTYRRISKTTNRYVPVYIPQEIDDRSKPQRAYLPIPTYGASPVPTTVTQLDLMMMQGEAFSQDITLPLDLTGKSGKAQIRLYPESAAIVAEFTCTVTDAANGVITISLTSEQTQKVGLRAYWDLEIYDTGDYDGTHATFVYGATFCKREITRL